VKLKLAPQVAWQVIVAVVPLMLSGSQT